MNDGELAQYKYFWTELNEFCLGPVIDWFTQIVPDWDDDYGIFMITPMYYKPIFIHTRHLRNQIIQRMLEAGCKVIDMREMDARQDVTRLWTDRRHEFVLKSKGVNQRDEYDYIIIHKKTGGGVLVSYSIYKRRDVIKKMVEAGVEIIKWQ